GRAQQVVAFAHDAAHVGGVATRAMGVVELLAAKQDVLRGEGADELLEFVRTSAGAARGSAGGCPAASTGSASAACSRGWRLLREQQQAGGDHGETGS